MPLELQGAASEWPDGSQSESQSENQSENQSGSQSESQRASQCGSGAREQNVIVATKGQNQRACRVRCNLGQRRFGMVRGVPLVLCGLAAVLAVVSIGGCSTLGFYQQAVAGQMRVLARRRSVAKLLVQPDTDPEFAQQLRLAADALAYAREELQLKVGKRYSSYTQLKGDFVVWNLVVASPDSVVPRQWCFPVAGCVVYRGYFSESKAQREAQKYRARGYDVHVGGVAAYSTLGWFNDPLLSSFINWPRPALVQLLFHELAHGELYAADDSEFNESFASFVAQKGIQIWLAGDRESAQVLAAQRRERVEARRFNELLIRLRSVLKADFARAPSQAAALDIRVQRFAQARECVAQWAQPTQQTNRENTGNGLGRERFNRYFTQPPNMARLALASAYTRWIAAFGQLFAESQPAANTQVVGDAQRLDWAAFYAAARELTTLAPAQRLAELQRLNASAAAHAAGTEARQRQGLQQQIQTESDDEDPGEIRCEAFSHHRLDRDVTG